MLRLAPMHGGVSHLLSGGRRHTVFASPYASRAALGTWSTCRDADTRDDPTTYRPPAKFHLCLRTSAQPIHLMAIASNLLLDYRLEHGVHFL